MIPVLLFLAAAAVYLLPLIVPKPPPPDDIAAPPGPPSPPTGVPRPVPFTDAVSALDVVTTYLASGSRFGPAQADAARVLRAALVEAATPLPPMVKPLEAAS